MLFLRRDMQLFSWNSFLDFWKSSEQIFFISVPYAVGVWALRCGVILLFTLNYHCVQSSEQKSTGQFCNSAQISDEQCFRKSSELCAKFFCISTQNIRHFWFLTFVQHPNKKLGPHLHENVVNQDFRKYIMINSRKLVTLSCPYCKTTILEKELPLMKEVSELHCVRLKVHKIEIFLASILKFVLFLY